MPGQVLGLAPSKVVGQGRGGCGSYHLGIFFGLQKPCSGFWMRDHVSETGLAGSAGIIVAAVATSLPELLVGSGVP